MQAKLAHFFGPGGRSGRWRIRYDALCLDGCAVLDRVASWACAQLPGMPQGRTHSGEGRREVCATRGLGQSSFGLTSQPDRSSYGRFIRCGQTLARPSAEGHTRQLPCRTRCDDISTALPGRIHRASHPWRQLTLSSHKVGSQTAAVTVESTAPVPDTQSATAGTIVEQGEISQLPYNGRHRAAGYRRIQDREAAHHPTACPCPHFRRLKSC